jgi:spore germination cell wall hydrolase CwlJ-like protein
MRLVSLLVSFSLLLLLLVTSTNASETSYQSHEHDLMHKFANLSLSEKEQIKCIATGIYNEARHEPNNGKIAVAKVILNRVDYGFAPTPCKVVYQTNMVKRISDDGETKKVKLCQFSWVCFKQKAIDVLDPAYHMAERIAFEVFIGMHATVVPANVLFFHSASINPNWSYRKYAKIGGNVFYVKN